MADKQNIPRWARSEAFANLSDNPSLSLFCGFPAPDALLGGGEKLICNGFELLGRKKPGRAAIVLVHRLAYFQMASECFRQWCGGFNRLVLSAADHVPGAKKSIRRSERRNTF